MFVVLVLFWCCLIKECRYLLDKSNYTNIIVVVTRWFGGTMLGADRFKHITAVAQVLLDQKYKDISEGLFCFVLFCFCFIFLLVVIRFLLMILYRGCQRIQRRKIQTSRGRLQPDKGTVLCTFYSTLPFRSSSFSLSPLLSSLNGNLKD